MVLKFPAGTTLLLYNISRLDDDDDGDDDGGGGGGGGEMPGDLFQPLPSLRELDHDDVDDCLSPNSMLISCMSLVILSIILSPGYM